MSRERQFKPGCPCGGTRWSGPNKPALSVVLQVGTLGRKVRLRSPAVTIQFCEPCVRLIATKAGRKLRIALATALQRQAVQIARQIKAAE
jgi:hypothetical protein